MMESVVANRSTTLFKARSENMALSLRQAVRTASGTPKSAMIPVTRSDSLGLKAIAT